MISSTKQKDTKKKNMIVEKMCIASVSPIRYPIDQTSFHKRFPNSFTGNPKLNVHPVAQSEVARTHRWPRVAEFPANRFPKTWMLIDG